MTDQNTHSINTALRLHEKKIALFIVLMALVIGIVIHGFFLSKGSYAVTYDAFVHMFFASKYRHNWFETWTYNWFEGFDLVSYPPLVHQLIAFFSHMLSIETSYMIVQLFGVVALITGAFRISSLWLAPIDAAWGAMSASFLTSLAQQIHQFGQLPTSFSVGFALHSGFYFVKWLGNARFNDLATALCYLCVVLTSHHLTFFLLVPVLFASLTGTFLLCGNSSRDQKMELAQRTGIFIFFAGVTCLIVLLPFISYVLHHLPAQREIPHATRLNYFADFPRFLNFFAVPLATTSIFIISMPIVWIIDRNMRGLIVCVGVLLLFGLGGTTPIPRILLGETWRILTFDRFAGWAAVLAIPLNAWWMSKISRFRFKMVLFLFQILLLVGYFMLLKSVKFQPDPVNLEKISNFLSDEKHSRFRYVTFGLGSQMAKLSYMTPAPTVDGLYFTARTTKVLRESGIESIDSAKYYGQRGESVVDEYLSNPAKYSLRFAIVNDQFYDKFLEKNNWHKLDGNFSGPIIWETKKEVTPLQESYFRKRSKIQRISRVLWGCYPIFFLVVIGLECFRFIKIGSNRERVDSVQAVDG